MNISFNSFTRFAGGGETPVRRGGELRQGGGEMKFAGGGESSVRRGGEFNLGGGESPRRGGGEGQSWALQLLG